MSSLQQPLFKGNPSLPSQLVTDYQEIRRASERLCEPLAIEDYVVQAMPSVSPPKWHLGHVSWFFETFLLQQDLESYKPYNPEFAFLFNSYYTGAGPQFTRANRGLLSRPTVKQVYRYRQAIDESMLAFIENLEPGVSEFQESVVVLGMNHEQQHQELLLTDIKYNLGINPLKPAYHPRDLPSALSRSPTTWIEYEGGLHRIGHDGTGFAFDNEWPRHDSFLSPYYLASQPVTNGEFIEFMESGGYQTVGLWMSEGWNRVRELGWDSPLYWEKIDNQWWSFTLSGMLPLDEHAPVTHVSYYEADAYARWRGYRLPSEQEWEQAAGQVELDGNLLEEGLYHPVAHRGNPSEPTQMIGDVWEWTQSPYTPYPGFIPWTGTIGEYNGKFMVNQMVLRGGSCVTPKSHIRSTYRNFFPPDARWQFSGIRLARDA